MNSISDSMDMSLSKLQETAKDSLWGCKQTDMTERMNDIKTFSFMRTLHTVCVNLHSSGTRVLFLHILTNIYWVLFDDNHSVRCEVVSN